MAGMPCPTECGTINGGKRVVNTDKIFDELLPVHAENQCIKGKLLFK